MDPVLIVFGIIFILIVLLMVKLAFKGNENNYSVSKIKPSDLHAEQAAYIQEWEQNPNKDRIHGLPGAGLIEAFGNKGITGMRGELATARRLNELIAKYPNLHIFHGVHYKGSQGDIDHLFVMGKTIILVDSKRWESNKEYRLVKSEKYGKLTALKNGQEFPGGNISLPLVRQRLGKDFASSEVLAVLCVETKGGRIYENVAENHIGFVRADSLPLRLDLLLSKAENKENSHIKTFINYSVKLPL
jgi:hypothetical protein